MAGKRMLHSNICESEKLGLVSYAAETLYYKLLTRVDDNGNFTADPRIIYGQCMVMREDQSPTNVTKLLIELANVSGIQMESRPLIQFYMAGNEKYLHITKFEDFQYLKNDRPATLKCPTHPIEVGISLTNGGFHPESERNPDGIPKLSEVKVSKDNYGLISNSFSGGIWKFIASRYVSYFGISPAGRKTDKEQYDKICRLYGEDKVLEIFDRWASGREDLKKNKWALQYFYKDIEAEIEGDQIRAERETQERASQPTKLSDDDLTRIQERATLEVNAEIARIDAQKAFDEAHKDEI